LVILIILPYVLYNTFTDSTLFKSTPELVTLTVPKGDRQEVILSDGSRIMLDAGSQFSYPAEFDANNRDIFLNGEGFFEVIPNPEKPFIVHAGDAVIKVLGTKFNVRAWQKYKKVQVAVAEGKVSLNSDQDTGQEAVILTAGLAGSLLENGLPSQPQKVDINQYLGWMHNEVVFDDAPLEEILFQLERWYDLQVILSDSAMAKEHLTVHIQSTSVKDIVELIGTLTDLDYKFAGNTVHLISKEIN
jgi:ferric-dicitrate binding protein FerR (iron transport regulator)